MGRRSKRERIRCEFFTWIPFQRSGVWYADGRGNSPDLGKHTLGTRDWDAALDNLRELDRIKAIEQGLAEPARVPRTTLSIDEGWRLFLESGTAPQELGGWAPGTHRCYRRVRNAVRKFCERNSIRTWEVLDSAAAGNFARWRRTAGRAPNTVFNDLRVLRAANRWLIANGFLTSDHLLSVRIPGVDESNAYCYTREEVRAMLQHCREQSGLDWLHDVIVVLSTTGVRIGELLGLRWRDVDLTAGTIAVRDERYLHRSGAAAIRTTKGRRSRIVDIGPGLRTVLEQLDRRGPSLLPGPDGRALHYAMIRTSFVTSVIEPLKGRFPKPEGEVGFEDGRLHAFRHFFVSECFRQGVSEAQIMDWVGHRDSKIVARYRHLRREDGQRMMNRIDFFGTNSAEEDRNNDSPAGEPQPATEVPAAATPPHDQRTTPPSQSMSQSPREAT